MSTIELIAEGIGDISDSVLFADDDIMAGLQMGADSGTRIDDGSGPYLGVRADDER